MSLEGVAMLFLLGISVGISIGLWMALRLVTELIVRRNKKNVAG
jgi:hypothetical protein